MPACGVVASLAVAFAAMAAEGTGPAMRGAAAERRAAGDMRRCELEGNPQVCGTDGCTVLVGGMMLKTCGEYCSEAGLGCANGWQSQDSGCAAQSTVGCDARLDVKKLLCQCRPPWNASRMEQYTVFDGANCYAARGAYEIGDAEELDTLESAAELCDGKRECEGFVVFQKWFYLRSNINLLLCEMHAKDFRDHFTMYANERRMAKRVAAA